MGETAAGTLARGGKHCGDFYFHLEFFAWVFHPIPGVKAEERDVRVVFQLGFNVDLGGFACMAVAFFNGAAIRCASRKPRKLNGIAVCARLEFSGFFVDDVFYFEFHGGLRARPLYHGGEEMKGKILAREVLKKG